MKENFSLEFRIGTMRVVTVYSVYKFNLNFVVLFSNKSLYSLISTVSIYTILNLKKLDVVNCGVVQCGGAVWSITCFKE